MYIETERLRLESISRPLAARIVTGVRLTGDAWHEQYPWVDELDPLRMLAEGSGQDPVFTLYLVRRLDDGLAVGGLGFFGVPDASGGVEIGYGLVPAARGAGLATEAVRAAVHCAGQHGAAFVRAETDDDNAASHHVLQRAGFTVVNCSDHRWHWEHALTAQRERPVSGRCDTDH